MRVIILAAGSATRLRPLSNSLPKTLIPVCNIPILARILQGLDAAGIRSATVTLPNAGKETTERAMSAAPPGFLLDLFFPAGPFPGSAAMVRSLLRPDDGTVLVIYGDSLLSVDFSDLLMFHERARKLGGSASILCHRPLDIRAVEADGCSLYGVMSIAENRRITRFVEKPRVGEIRLGFDLANAAVFIVEQELLKDTRLSGAKDFSYDVFQPAVNAYLTPLFACDIGEGFRYDIGGLRRLYLANMDVLNGRMPAPLPGQEERPGVWTGSTRILKSVRVVPPVLIGDGVEIANGAEIGPDVVLGDRCWIGAGSVIRHSILLEECCLLSGVTMDYCILGSRCKIGPDVALPHFTAMDASGFIGQQLWSK